MKLFERVKHYRFKHLVFILLPVFFVYFISISNAEESYEKFSQKVTDDFMARSKANQITKRVAVNRDGDEFDFAGTLQDNYVNFSHDRYIHDDFVDAYYFKKKADKIKNYKIISPSNPYSFGILPDDMQQFIIGREQLRSVSINSIVNSNDGLVLADSYIAYDCWLEAFEEGNSHDRMQRCRARFLDNMKAMRLSLLAQGYNVFELTTKEDLALNARLSTCESCKLYARGLFCNSLYFEPYEAKMMDKMNVVVKRLQRKMSYFSSATIQIMYYKNAFETDKGLSKERLNAVKNLAYNTLSSGSPVKPILKVVALTLPNEQLKNKIFRDAITVCISGNE